MTDNFTAGENEILAAFKNNIYFFEKQVAAWEEFSIFWPTTQMARTDRTGPGQSQDPGTTSGSTAWVAEARVPGYLLPSQVH